MFEILFKKIALRDYDVLVTISVLIVVVVVLTVVFQ